MARPSASGAKASPVRTPAVSRSGARTASAVRAADTAVEGDEPRVAAPRRPQQRAEQDRRREVRPEHGAPAGRREDDRPGQRAEHAAELLDGAHRAEREAPALDRPPVGDEGERRGHEPSAAQALQAAAEHRGRQGVRAGGEQRPDREGEQARDEHGDAAAQVREPADERQDRDVAEEEGADERGAALQLVDAQPDAGHHLGQHEDDDVGVRRREQDGDRGDDERTQRRGVRRRRGCRHRLRQAR